MRRGFLVFAIVVGAAVTWSVSAWAQNDGPQCRANEVLDDDGECVELATRFLEFRNLDILGDGEAPHGQFFRGRSRAEFPMLMTLERDLSGGIEEDAKSAALD